MSKKEVAEFLEPRINKLLSEARASEALQCAADVCSMCGEDSAYYKPPELRNGKWMHPWKEKGGWTRCAAGPIHERLHLHTQSAKSAKPEISQKSGKTGLL